MSYDFKRLPELGWAVGIAIALVLFQVLVDFDPETVENWKTWAVAVGAAGTRAAGAAGLNWLRQSLKR